MIILDANLLLCAYDEASAFHLRAKSWWSACLSGPEPVGLVAVVLFVSEAADHVKRWLEAPATELLAVTRADVDQALAWLNEAGSGGNLTTDAQIAAVARRCHARVHTADTDFARFPGVRWKNPVL